jgi:hypothetical protein
MAEPFHGPVTNQAFHRLRWRGGTGCSTRWGSPARWRISAWLMWSAKWRCTASTNAGWAAANSLSPCAVSVAWTVRRSAGLHPVCGLRRAMAPARRMSQARQPGQYPGQTRPTSVRSSSHPPDRHHQALAEAGLPAVQELWPGRRGRRQPVATVLLPGARPLSQDDLPFWRRPARGEPIRAGEDLAIDPGVARVLS